MRKTNAIRGALDYPVRERRLERLLDARQPQRLRFRLSQRGQEHECRTRRRRQGIEPGVKQAVECLRHRQRTGGLELGRERARELEGVERIPARGLVDAE